MGSAPLPISCPRMSVYSWKSNVLGGVAGTVVNGVNTTVVVAGKTN